MHVYSAAELFLCSEASVSNSDSGTGTTTSTEEHVTATSEVPPPSLDSPASSAERIQQPSSSAVGRVVSNTGKKYCNSNSNTCWQ